MVCNSLVARITTAFSVWFLITSILSAVMPTALWAQSIVPPDFESPIIEHAASQGGFIGGVEVIGATVVDNADVERVSLFYRFTGETEFAELLMREVASSSYYSAKVDTANVPSGTEAIEYYLQAADTSGNIVLKGFAFQPLTRAFLSTPVSKTEVKPEPSQPSALSKVNWLYVALGALVVGGVVAAVSDEGSGTGTECCRVNVTIPPPETQ